MRQSTIKARLITNPRSGHGGVDLSSALTVLREHGWEVEIRQKLYGGHATELAQEAAHEGCHVVVDCGGDGTLNELVEGVLGTETAVGTIPGGTANLWAHEVGIAAHLQVAALQLVGAERRQVDVGRVTVNGKHTQHFVLMAGVGVDGAIISRVNKPIKNRIGRAAVVLAALQALPSTSVVPVQMTLDDLHWQGRICQIIVGNTRRYGGFTRITADAFADDGMFDVCMITATGLLSASRVLGSLLLQRHLSPDVGQYYRAARVILSSPVTLPLQVDGGSIKLDDEQPTSQGTRYEFSILEGGVTMLVPRTYSGELFRPIPMASMSVSVASPARSRSGSNQHERDEAKDAEQNGKQNGHGKHWRMTLLEIGVDSLTAARAKDSGSMHVKIDPDTTFEDSDGKRKRLLSAMSSLAIGDQLQVTGNFDGDNRAVHATHVARAAHKKSPKHGKS